MLILVVGALLQPLGTLFGAFTFDTFVNTWRDIHFIANPPRLYLIQPLQLLNVIGSCERLNEIHTLGGIWGQRVAVFMLLEPDGAEALLTRPRSPTCTHTETKHQSCFTRLSIGRFKDKTISLNRTHPTYFTHIWMCLPPDQRGIRDSEGMRWLPAHVPLSLWIQNATHFTSLSGKRK